MRARVDVAVAIPQTFQDRPVNVPAIRDSLVRAEALGFHSAWVVEQTLIPLYALIIVSSILSFCTAFTACGSPAGMTMASPVFK